MMRIGNTAENSKVIQEIQLFHINILSEMKGVVGILIFCVLLLAPLTHSQTNSVDASVADGTVTFESIFGYGPPANVTIGTRDPNSVQSGSQDSNLVPPVVVGAPAPAIQCPFNQMYDNILCKCVCVLGYFFQANACVPYQNYVPNCAKNQIYQNGRCACANGFYLIGTVCDVCPPYSTYDIPTLSCPCIYGYALNNGNCALIYVAPPTPPVPVVPICGVNQQVVNNICICLQNYYTINGVCTLCVAPQFYDLQNNICRLNCNQDQVYDIGSQKCICNSGLFNIDGTCKICPAYAVYNAYTKQCDCIINYVLQSGICVPATYAPLPPSPPLTPVNPCLVNQVFVNGQCICSKGFNLINGVCVQCTNGTFYDPALGVCRIPCLANEAYNLITKVCNCAPNYFRINGVCTKCQGNSTFNSKTNKCSCPDGFRLYAGNCISGCGLNEVLNNGICCCILNYYPVNGVCGQCEWNQIYDQGLGICRLPCDKTRIYSLITSKCECLPQYYALTDGTCGFCPTNSQYDATTLSCVCNDGYNLNLGLCQLICNAYETWVNGTCQCKTGYYLIGYSCGVCPPLLTYDATYRICRQGCGLNEVYDASLRICRCAATFYYVGTVCSQCNATTQVYDQKTRCCNCIDGYHKVAGQGCNGVCTPICTATQDWVGGRCTCKPGYYLINNFCVQCPQGQFYDVYQLICRAQCGTNQVYDFLANKCVCATGYYVIQGICSICPTGYTYSNYTQTCTIVPCPGENQYFSNSINLCVCKPQYVRIKNICTACPPGFYFDDHTGTCLCKPGNIQKNGFCVPLCPSDQTFVNGVCVCIDPTAKMVNNICRTPVVCPTNTYSPDGCNCCLCQDGYFLSNGICRTTPYCGINSFEKYGKCSCSPGFYLINNQCQACGVNQAYNGFQCECMIGFIRDLTGNCIVSNFIPNCYTNERYDTDLKTCVCIQGTQFLRGTCQTIPNCPTNSNYNGVQCVCNTGFILSNNQCQKVTVSTPTCPAFSAFNGLQCVCVAGYFPIVQGSCSQCPSGQSWNGNACSSSSGCTYGFVLNTVSNQCEPSGASCGSYATYNGATCVCQSGYNMINGQCVQCSTGTVFDGKACSSTVIVNPTITCNSNQVFVNNQCVCSDGFYNINNSCLSCPDHSSWNGVACICNNSNVANWCMGQVYTQNVNGSCVCQSGYTQVNGICTSSS